MHSAVVIENAHVEPITALAYDSLHKVVYSAAQERHIKAWDVKGQGQCLAVITAHKGWVTHLLFCEGLNVLLSGGIDGYITISDERFKILQVSAPRSARGSALAARNMRRCLPPPQWPSRWPYLLTSV